MKICIINKYYLPDQGITALSTHDLALQMHNSGHEVHVVCTKSHYGKKMNSGDEGIKVHSIKSIYDGKQKILRLPASFIDSWRLSRLACTLSADIFIIMTSPPLLNYVASRMMKRKNRNWVYWSLDLYPEAFAANGLISKRSRIYTYIFRGAYNYPPVYLLTLGNLQKEYLQKCFDQPIPSSIITCGTFIHRKAPVISQTIPEWKSDPKIIYFGYIGNLGEAHSLEFIQYVGHHLDEEKHRLVLSVYGSKSAKLKAFVKHNSAIILIDYLPDNEFEYIDIHLASLQEQWVNICVPSKIVTSVASGGCFIFYGPENCDSWQQFSEAGWRIEPQADAHEKIQDFLSEITQEKIELKKNKAKTLSKQVEQDLQEGYNNFNEFLEKKDKEEPI